jgi:hypothetical protein
VSSWVITTETVGLVTSRVIQSKSGNGETLNLVDVEAMGRPVLDVEVCDLTVV